MHLEYFDKSQDFLILKGFLYCAFKSYFIAGTLDDQVFLCVSHGGLNANLYVSDEEGIRYSLSLERVFYFDPKKAPADTWLRCVY